ncbi:MAG: hypothetical protein VW438_06210, partial [Euryarchaeota archaeon]
DSIVATFGDTIGWVVGHGLIVGLIALVWYAWVGREHIRTKSGWGMPEIRDAATIIAVTMAQYIVYTSNLDYPAIRIFSNNVRTLVRKRPQLSRHLSPQR